MWIENAIGFLIAAVLLVSSAKGFRCWYREFRDSESDLRVQLAELPWELWVDLGWVVGDPNYYSNGHAYTQEYFDALRVIGERKTR